MKFRRPPKPFKGVDVSKYLFTDLFSWLINIFSGLQRLSFTDNFDSLLVQNLVIGAGDTAIITNSLRRIPSYRIIVRHSGAADSLITDGEWDINFLRLINNGTGSATISVIFFR